MLSSKSSTARLNLERHGAIRVGTADEVNITSMLLNCPAD